MAKRHPAGRAFGTQRYRLVARADALFAKAKAALAEAEVITPSQPAWARAATAFEESATHYRKAGLGLMARASYEHASRCHTEGGKPDKAEECSNLADVIPAYWEEAADG